MWPSFVVGVGVVFVVVSSSPRVWASALCQLFFCCGFPALLVCPQGQLYLVFWGLSDSELPSHLIELGVDGSLLTGPIQGL